MFRVAFLSAFVLVGMQVKEASAQSSARATTMNPNAWVIGPIINGRTYSRGAPLHPSQGLGREWYIELPRRPGSIHAVTFRHGSLAGKRRIVMRYRIETAAGVRIDQDCAWRNRAHHPLFSTHWR